MMTIIAFYEGQEWKHLDSLCIVVSNWEIIKVDSNMTMTKSNLIIFTASCFPSCPKLYLWQSSTCQHHTGPGIDPAQTLWIPWSEFCNPKSTAALLCIRKIPTVRSLKMEKESIQTVFQYIVHTSLALLSNIELQNISIQLLLVLPKYTGSPGDISLIPGTAQCFHFYSRPNCCRKKSCCSCRVITWTANIPSQSLTVPPWKGPQSSSILQIWLRKFTSFQSLIAQLMCQTKTRNSSPWYPEFQIQPDKHLRKRLLPLDVESEVSGRSLVTKIQWQCCTMKSWWHLWDHLLHEDSKWSSARIQGLWQWQRLHWSWGSWREAAIGKRVAEPSHRCGQDPSTWF